MKPLALFLVCMLAAGDGAYGQQNQAPPATPAAPPPPNTLLDGTPVKLRLSENLSSETAKAGQQVAFEVTEEVDVEGVAVILKGATALATVTNVSPKKTMGRGGKLDVNVDSVRLVDNEKVQLRAVRDAKGGGHVGAMTGAIVATSIIFFPAAPLFLFIHGKSVEIPKGTEVTAFVEGDDRLDLSKMVVPVAATVDALPPVADPKPPAVAVAPAAPAPAPAPEAMATLTVESNIAGADIEVDGDFAGSTPSTLSLKPGQHTIAVKKKGYAVWTRSLNVSGNGVKLSAELEVEP